MSDCLDLGEFSELVGCSTGRVRQMYRMGLMEQWDHLIQVEPYKDSDHIGTELVTASHAGLNRVRFHRELLADPRLFALMQNSVEPSKFGPGWEGHREDTRPLPGVIEPARIKALKLGQRPPRKLRMIARIPAPPTRKRATQAGLGRTYRTPNPPPVVNAVIKSEKRVSYKLPTVKHPVSRYPSSRLGKLPQ